MISPKNSSGATDFNFHDGLLQHRAALLNAFFEGHRTGHLEGHFIRVYFVERTIVQPDVNIGHRVASQHAAFGGFADTLLYSRDIFLGDHAAYNVVIEYYAGAALAGFQLEHDVPVLPVAAGLLDVAHFGFLNRAG